MNLVIDGIRFYLNVSQGDNPPLLLLHGFTGDHTTWLPFYDSWGKQAKIYGIDIIGHGKSDKPDKTEFYGITLAASHLKKILDRLEIEKTDLLGYSMGGRLAMTFAVLYPEMVNRLILESTSPGLKTEEERISRKMQDEKLAHFIRQKGIAAFVDYWSDIRLFQSQKQLPVSKQEALRRQRLQNNSLGLMNSLLAMGTGSQPSWWDALGKITARTLLITGSLDNKFCLIAEEMSKEINNVEWRVVENCGHAIHMEESEKFATIVSDFLSKYERGGDNL
ncbi:2-succinyl-6-hydroxy-2,4-cyclohexadiene-1-carboxylate synthase [Bacillaceae bacterium Marseille-Q3522]|nr:2-succinyl-6-hydroxy-2,4-cyclohexadiene-1-carboxylate synthase [Bacillaceae bacterium Marseille-Q3522]